MIVSEARREANRRNAKLSTGPKTEAGKERSRQNALTHGLSARVVNLPEDGPAIAADPAVDWPGFLVEQVTTITAKLRRCDRLDRRHRERISLRAETFWDDDRRLEAEFLGSGIARDPAAIARSLRMTPHGCDWMIERWSLLARAADRDGSWTADQRSLAFDLLGRPQNLRGDDPTERVDLEGRPAAAGDRDLATLARREVATLLARKGQVAPIDALDRAGARTDPDARDDLDLRRLHRHEADLHRRLRWCAAQLSRVEAPPPRPEPRPAPLDDPGFDLGPDADLFAEMEAIMAQANALRRPQAQPQPSPATSRPDPRAALEKTRDGARKAKRDRRQA